MFPEQPVWSRGALQELVTSSVSFFFINIWHRTLVCLCVLGTPVEEGVGWTPNKMKEK